MTATAVKAELKDIQALRALFLQETNCQIRYNACHERGWTDSYLLTIQELKKECYLAGRVPAARCELRNTASRATLIKAGLRVCGFMLTGKTRAAEVATRSSADP